MKKLTKIAWAETFVMYVHVSFKVSSEITNKLKLAGYSVEVEDQGSDHKISVEVTVETCAFAKSIIASIIH